jgi:F-type H+-transporting ATPase subunit b
MRGDRTLRLLAVTIVVGLCAVAPAVAAEGAEQETYAGDIGQAIAAVLIFAVLLAILGKFAWKPIIAQLRQREEGVAKQLDDAAKRQKESEELLAEYRARLDRAESDAQRLVEDSKKEAARDRQRLLDQARAEAEKHAEQAKRDIEQARRKAVRELHEETAELAAEIASSVLGASLDDDTRRKLVDDSLEEIRLRSRERV